MAATPITWDDVEAFATELADDAVTDDAQDMILEYANTALGESLFKPAAYKLARILLAAHMATMTAAGGGGSMAAGPVLSETVGPLSRTYADLVSGGTTGFSGSTYGDQLSYLIRTSRARWPRIAP